MHILFDARIHLDFMSGISRYILMLLENMFEQDTTNQFTVFVNGKLPKDNEIYAICDKKNVNVIPLDVHHFGPVNYLKMPGIIRKINPDVYHYPHLDAPISGIPTVATILDANIRKGVKKYNDFLGLKTLYFKKSLKNTLKKTQKSMFISDAVMDDVLDLLQMEKSPKYMTVHLGVDESFKDFDESASEAILKKFNIQKPYFLYVGTIREHKNIDRLIKAFVVSNLHPEYSLVLAGGKYEGYDVDMNQPGVNYIGRINEEELKILYKNGFCFVFPSLLEGFGLPILESYMLDLPVITSNMGATKEVGGNAAHLVDPLDIDDISKGMVKVATDDDYRNSMIAKGKTRVEEFKWGNTARKVLSVYEEVFKEASTN